MEKQYKMLIYGISFLIVVLALTTFFPKGILFNRALNIVRDDTLRISSIDININKQWLVFSDKSPIVIGSKDGAISMLFSVVKGNKKAIENHKKYLESKEIPIESEILQVGCRRSNALIYRMAGPIANNEIYEIAFEPDIIVHVNVVVDNNMKQREDIIKNFLANNVICTGEQVR